MDFWKKIFDGFTIEKTVRRLLTSWFFACFVSAVSSDAPKGEFLYFEKTSIASVSFAVHILTVCVLFAALTAVFTFFENELHDTKLVAKSATKQTKLFFFIFKIFNNYLTISINSTSNINVENG